jgi:hypothetical protein
MYKNITLFLLVVLLFSCTKDVFVSLEPTDAEENLSPQGVEITVNKITDSTVNFIWTKPSDPENDEVLFDIAVNDSVILVDYEYLGYEIKNLYPDSDYKISIIAHDKYYNQSINTINIRTEKSFLNAFYPLDLGYDKISIYASVETSDGGFIFCGLGQENEEIRNDFTNFVTKYSADFKVEWSKRFEWDLHGGMSIIETTDNNYITVWSGTVTKFNTQGDILWQYNCPPTLGLSGGFISVTETADREILLTGHKIARPLKYGLLKLDANGNQLWFKQGGTKTDTRADFVTTTNEKILISGTIERPTFDGSEENILWLLQLDKNGDFIRENIYENEFKGSDVINSIEIMDDGNYLLTGSVRGYVGEYIGFIPRFLKVNPEGEILWDKFPNAETTGGGFFRVLRRIKKINNENYLIHISDDRGFAIATMNESGDITQYIRTTNYPDVRGLSLQQNGFYRVLTDYGVFVFDPDGFIGNY